MSGGSGRVVRGTASRLSAKFRPQTAAGTIGSVRERWLSRRAVSLHVGVLLFVPGCALAAWWQVTRAFDGNGLSYLYSVEWPIFAVVAIYFWWMLIHTDYETVGLKGMRRQAEALGAEDANEDEKERRPVPPPAAQFDVDDPELAAYNARLAQLASRGPKTWRTSDPVVVRRPR